MCRFVYCHKIPNPQASHCYGIFIRINSSLLGWSVCKSNNTHLGNIALERMEKMKEEHAIVGDVRAKGCLMGIELVKDKNTKEPFDEAGKRVYQKAFAKGLAWIPAGHILRMSPPVVMEDEVLLKGLDMIDEAIGETEKELL